VSRQRLAVLLFIVAVVVLPQFGKAEPVIPATSEALARGSSELAVDPTQAGPTAPNGSAESTNSSATEFATLLIRQGSWLVALMGLIATILAAFSGVAAFLSGRSYRESEQVSREMEKLEAKCTEMAEGMGNQAQELQVRIERIFLDAAVHDLAKKESDPETVSRRYVAICGIGELGHYQDISFLLAGHEKAYETDENRQAITQGIAKIIAREGAKVSLASRRKPGELALEPIVKAVAEQLARKEKDAA